MTTITETDCDSFLDGIDVYDNAELIKQLSKIPMDNIALKIKTRVDLKGKGFNVRDFTKLWRQAHPAAEAEWVELDESLGEVLYEYHLNADTYVRMRNDGIYFTNNKEDKDSGDRYVKESHIIFWRQFKITGKYLMTFGMEGECLTKNEAYAQEWRYNGVLDDVTFFHETEELVKRRLQDNFTGNGGRDYVTGVLDLALDDSNFAKDITSLYRQVMGFTVNGWQLPDKYYFALHDDITKKMYFKLKQVLERKYNKTDTIQRIKNLYLHTGIEHKDIMFSWATYAPFAMALRDYYGLMAMLAMGGVGDRGKSPQAYTMTGLFYGHMDANLGDTIQKSYSQMQSWMSSSAFPIVLDDCENLPEESAGEIKSYTTAKSNMQKKGGGPNKQGLTVDKPYCANICMTFNRDPIAFRDSFFRERSLYMVIQTLQTDPLWRDAQLAIQSGDFLLLLYEYSKAWKIADLRKLVDSFTTEGLTTDRNKKIIKFIKLGQYLFKEMIGIDLQLEGIKNMILMNNDLNTMELLEALRKLYDKGRYLDDHTEFKSTQYWITSPWREGIYKKVKGYVLDLNNIRDLQIIIEGNTRDKWTFQCFYQKICPKLFPNAIFDGILFYALTMNLIEGSYELKGEKTRGIFIPMGDMSILNQPKEDFKRESKPNKEESIKTKILQLEGDAPFTMADITSSMAGENIEEDDVGQAITHLLAVAKIYETNIAGEYKVTRGNKT